MKQILLVLRKDCRRLWPEVVLTLAMTALFVWLSPYVWRNSSPAAPHWFALDWQRFQILANLVEALLPVTWLILISRVIHEENLVGNRQFWLTRPYKWQALLAAKLLFVALFVGVPFGFSQVCLLIRAGFSPSAYLPNLGVALLLVAGFIVVPMIALAAVTRTLLRIVASLLSVVVILGALAFLGTDFSFGPAVSIPYSDRITIPIILAFSATVLVAQYSGRKLWLSRTLLVILCVTVAGLAMQPFGVSLLERIYQLPYPGHANPFVIVQDAASTGGITATSTDGKSVHLSIPIEIKQIPADGQVTPDDVRVTIDNADGAHWTSPWQPVENHRLSKQAPRDRVSVTIDRKMYDRLRISPLSFHVGLAFTQLAEAETSSLIFDPRHDLALPHVGNCTYEGGETFLQNNLSCRVALHSPPLTRITIARSPAPCKENADLPGGQPDSTWIEGSVRPDAATLDLSPIRTMDLILPSYQPITVHQKGSAQLALCPGSPIKVTSFRLVRRFQYQLDIPATLMPEAGRFSRVTM